MSALPEINGGLYLVADPALGSDYVLPRIEAALKGGVDIVQIWNHWHPGQDPEEFIHSTCSLVHSYGKPVLINQRWEWLLTFPLDGIHFDTIPPDWNSIVNFLKRPFLKGITSGNDNERVQWAIDHNASYISFCAMFPSSSADNCELVSPEVVRNVRKTTSMPLFASGGITPQNTSQVMSLGIDGVAVISAILKAEDPEGRAKEFKEAMGRDVRYESR